MQNDEPKASGSAPPGAQLAPGLASEIRHALAAEGTAEREQQIDTLLRLATGNDPAVWDKLMPLVYAELRRLANHLMAGEPAGQTLQPTALVNEAFIKIMRQPDVTWADKNHFINAVAQVMRRIMIDRARRKKAIKHGGDRRRIDMNPDSSLSGVNLPQIEGFNHDDAELLDAELTRLEQERPRWAEVVRFRYFAGLSIEQVAEAMNLSERTVRADWRFARAWLLSRINGEGDTTLDGRIADIRKERQRKSGHGELSDSPAGSAANEADPSLNPPGEAHRAKPD